MAPTAKEVAETMLSHPSPVVKAPQLAEEMDCSDEHVRQQLETLHLNDVVDTLEAGARARAWWHTERVCGPRAAPADDPAQSDLRDHEADAGAPERDVDRETTDDPGAGGSDGLADDLDALDLPGGQDVLDDRRDSLRACYELIMAEGSVSRKDFIRVVYEGQGHTAGYGSGPSWWGSFASGALRDLADRRDDIEPPTEGRRGDSSWTFISTE